MRLDNLSKFDLLMVTVRLSWTEETPVLRQMWFGHLLSTWTMTVVI